MQMAVFNGKTEDIDVSSIGNISPYGKDYLCRLYELYVSKWNFIDGINKIDDVDRSADVLYEIAFLRRYGFSQLEVMSQLYEKAEDVPDRLIDTLFFVDLSTDFDYLSKIGALKFEDPLHKKHKYVVLGKYGKVILNERNRRFFKHRYVSLSPFGFVLSKKLYEEWLDILSKRSPQP